jgi:hypothetical protein
MDADTGLHGITARETLPYDSEFILLNKELTSYKVAISRPSLVDQVRRCHWNKQGWTYQEHCLSQRCLYFTADEVFFSCKQFQWREGYALEQFSSSKANNMSVRTGPPWWSHRIEKDPDPSPHNCLIGKAQTLTFEKYQMVVQEYCRRKLGYPQDILNAFQGIFNRFCGSHASEDPWAGHAQGVPPKFLPEALLWYPLRFTDKRFCGLEQGGSKEEFSSWSWASWSGPVDFVYSKNSGLDSTWDSSGFISGGSNRCSLVVEWQFPPSTSPTWKEARSLAKSNMENLRKVFHLEFETMDKIRSQGHRPIEAPSNGLVEFWAPILLSNISFSHRNGNLCNLYIELPPGSLSKERASGRFRFDDPVEEQEVDELVAIMISPGVISCIGMVRKDEKTFTRIGIGSIFAPGYHYLHGELDIYPNIGLQTLWGMRLVSMR